MTTTEAKEIVQNLFNAQFGTQPGMLTILQREALKIVENALDNQTATAPENICHIKSTDMIIEYFKKGNCPSCNHEVFTANHAYCPKCGKKLDWSQPGAE